MNDLTPIRLGLIKVQGATERMIRQAAPPHYLTVTSGMHGLVGEIEEVLLMRAPQKKLLRSMLERSHELNLVLIGGAAMWLAKGGRPRV